MTTFQRPVNNFSVLLAAQHTSGSGTLTLAAGTGALLGALGSSEVYRVTVYTGAAPAETIRGVFEATGRTGDQLTGVTAVEGYADSTIAVGAKVEVRATAKTFNDIHAAIQNLEVVTESAITGAVTLDATAFGRSFVCSGTAADYTVTLPTAVGKTGQTIAFRMSTALTRFVTLDGNGTETIDGQATRVLWAGELVVIMSDGANWTKVGGRSLPLRCSLLNPTATQSIPAGTLTTVQFTQVGTDNSTRMADLASFRILIQRTGLYRVSVKMPWSNLPANISRLAAAVHRINDATVTRVNAEQSGLLGGFPALNDSQVISLTAGTDNLYVKVYQNHSAAASLDANANGATPLLSVVEEVQW